KPGVPERVVDAFESMERNEAGKAELENKDRHDKSHWPCASACIPASPTCNSAWASPPSPPSMGPPVGVA
ncbi:MAG: hypothetical protein ACO26U_14075, partial [Burkholderiaceae bacterium]